MAEHLRRFAQEKAELVSGRLKELLSDGQSFLQAHFGYDFGLKPEVYPPWLVLSTVSASLLLLLAASWAALRGGLVAGKQWRSPVTAGGEDPGDAACAKSVNQEEQRKKNKKKPADKKIQSNGQPVAAVQEEVLAVACQNVTVEEDSATVKKNKKKPKCDVKPVQNIFTYSGKETDEGKAQMVEGAWETKVSNREKKQQRRREKGSDDSGSPRSVDASKTNVGAPTAKVPGQRSQASPGWIKESSAGDGGWSDMALKSRVASAEAKKWSSSQTAPHQITQREVKQGLSGIDSSIKTELGSTPFSIAGLKTSDALSSPADSQWTNTLDVDEWSGFNGIGAADHSSDWNAPTEHWGNYEEPTPLVEASSLLKDQSDLKKVVEDEKSGEDPSGGESKVKKKKKKKKKGEGDASSAAQTQNTDDHVVPPPITKTVEVSVPPAKKPNNASLQKKPEPMKAPTIHKKRVRKDI